MNDYMYIFFFRIHYDGNLFCIIIVHEYDPIHQYFKIIEYSIAI